MLVGGSEANLPKSYHRLDGLRQRDIVQIFWKEEEEEMKIDVWNSDYPYIYIHTHIDGCICSSDSHVEKDYSAI